jgi:hypothetical protein
MQLKALILKNQKDAYYMRLANYVKITLLFQQYRLLLQ